MKRAIFTFTTVFILTNLFGQKTEYRLGFNSGLFSFAGRSSEAVSAINYDGHSNSAYTNNPYGSQNGLCYGISGNLKRVSKKNFIFGVDVGYENLNSKIAINEVNDFTGTATLQYQASGKTVLHFNFINLHPFAGYRIVLKPLNVDITGGIEFGHCLQATEKGSAAATNGVAYKTSVNRKTIKTDIRPRLQLSSDYKKFGAYVGYSFGQANYKAGYIGGTNESYARIFRFGVTYRLY